MVSVYAFGVTELRCHTDKCKHSPYCALHVARSEGYPHEDTLRPRLFAHPVQMSADGPEYICLTCDSYEEE
ncbi:hypothetical protein LCGC14_1698190 [marine sediment metagenome]|uniref:Uncharacterized protein n=1 Tax=marine sediment metagenome TaxID=412755 RepID=A0A0F9KIR9_9ZZZZ